MILAILLNTIKKAPGRLFGRTMFLKKDKITFFSGSGVTFSGKVAITNKIDCLILKT